MTSVVNYFVNCGETFDWDKYEKSMAWGFTTGTVLSGGNVLVGIADACVCAVACAIHQFVMPYFQGVVRPGTFLGDHPYLLRAIPITLAAMVLNGIAGEMIVDSSAVALAYVAKSWFNKEKLDAIVNDSMYRFNWLF